MFFGNDRIKDEEIAQLKAKIKALEEKASGEDALFNEINDVLTKFEKGLVEISLKQTSQNPKLNSIKEALNKALQTNANFSNQIIKTLIEYGNANFEYPVSIEGISGKTGSIILGVRALGSSISELLAILDMTSNELNNEMIELANASNMLANASNQQAASLEETAAALEEVTSTIVSTNENTALMAKLSTEVSNSASKGQELANETFVSMDSINQEVSAIDQAIVVIDQIAFPASQISSQSKSIQTLAQTLVDVVGHTKYNQNAKKQVCDVDLMFTLNRLKLDHINFKDSNFAKLDNKATFKVTASTECNLGKWLDVQEREGKTFTKTQNWTHLKDVHNKVHSGVQGIVDNNNAGNLAKMLSDTLEIDKAISDVFWTIQQTKIENCGK
ncbi:MAG: CZB domain-containing protein [Arcobacter sp.]|nr:CZB domain-containing protein [Arcobacter sp.]